MNPFLEGPFAPVTAEETLTDLPVSGRLPAWLDGRYLRNGPNPIAPDPATSHWFAGDGMVHGVRLRDGRAEWYRNRWVRPSSSGAGVQPPNTNVVGHGGRILAIAEAGCPPYELTGDLDTVGPCNFGGTLPAGFTAHPHHDPVTGELHALAYGLGDDGGRVVYQYLVVGTDSRVTRVVDVEPAGSPMMHDFALTEHHAVFLDLPVQLTPDEATWTDIPARWDPDYPAALGVLPRDGTAVRWFPIEPGFVFHVLNAYEEGDLLLVDVVRFPSMFSTPGHHGPDTFETSLTRWTLDLGSGAVKEERFDDRPQEFPRPDERRFGRPYRYGYAVGIGTGLLKHDLVAGTTAVRDFELGDVPGEFVFVPSAPDAAEDEGVLIGLVQRLAIGRSDLVVLDAATLETVAAVHLPVRVPLGFHGNWVPN